MATFEMGSFSHARLRVIFLATPTGAQSIAYWHEIFDEKGELQSKSLPFDSEDASYSAAIHALGKRKNPA
jgi:hypothetical protein